MSKLLMAFCVVLPLTSAASAQTASELADKYPHHEVYEVKPGVQMTAKFASNGLVCRMEIEQARFTNKGVDLSNGIDESGMTGLIDQVVPPSERGERTRERDGGDVTGQVFESIVRWKFWGGWKSSLRIDSRYVVWGLDRTCPERTMFAFLR